MTFSLRRAAAAAALSVVAVLGAGTAAQAMPATAPQEVSAATQTLSGWQRAGTMSGYMCTQRGDYAVRSGYAWTYMCLAAPYGQFELWLLVK
ncbi:hypothetical protein ACFV7Q_11280 [Streptomyces sp. NPDC059851]|uniref:hypothetical protein n=1 Tax=Streptomyces sp. NPDC059851 TaxID=3346971 RepID=UPI00366452BE